MELVEFPLLKESLSVSSLFLGKLFFAVLPSGEITMRRPRLPVKLGFPFANPYSLKCKKREDLLLNKCIPIRDVV